MKKLFYLFLICISFIFISCQYTEEVGFEPTSKYSEYHNSYETYTWNNVKDSKGNVVSRTKRWHHHSAKTLYYVVGIASYEIVEYSKLEDGTKVRNIIEKKRVEEHRSISYKQYASYFCHEEPEHKVHHSSGGYGW